MNHSCLVSRFSTLRCLFACAGLALVLAGCSKTAKDAAPPAATAATPATAAGAPGLDSVEQRVSYGVGYNMGAKLGQQKDFPVDRAAFKAGVEDGLSGAKTRVAEAAIEAAFAEMQQKIAAAGAAEGEKQLAVGKTFLDKNRTKAGVQTTASGLQYEVLQSGKGAHPKPTDMIVAHYHGTLIDGTVFDSSVQRGQPIEIGCNQVIPGWTEALLLMSVGDKWRLTIPSNLGYGARASGKIPANSVLIFDVELLGIK